MPGQLISRHRRWLLGLTIVLVACVMVVASADGFDPDSKGEAARATFLSPVGPHARSLVIHVSRAVVGHPISPGFVGLSLEYTTIEPYAGSNPAAIDPVLVHLIQGLAPGQRPVLRIGGDTTDWAWWPVPHMTRPAGIRVAIGPRFAAVLGALAKETTARLILGIDLEADRRRISALEAKRLMHAVGRSAVAALELGNEPELYGTWPWRVIHGRRIVGRPAGYNVTAYIRDFRFISEQLPANVGLAGPALGGPKWISHVGQFIAGEPRLALITVHTYPLQECYTPLVSPAYPSLAHLLAASSSQGLAEGLTGAIRTAHRRGLPLRVDEINSVSCGGAPGVSNTFASALWALDTMFALARTGVDGVNIHTFQIARYRLFRTRLRGPRWWAAVAPEYYGLLLFAQAAPPGARLLRLTRGRGAVHAWATAAPDGTTRVVLINDSPAAGHVVEVRGSLGAGPAAYEALRAPSLRATGRVTLGGMSFGAATETGILPSPRRIFVHSSHGAYVVRLPAASAVMLTVGRAS